MDSETKKDLARYLVDDCLTSIERTERELAAMDRNENRVLVRSILITAILIAAIAFIYFIY